MIIALGVSTLFGQCAGHVCPGDRGGSDEMLSVRRQRAVLAIPQNGFRMSGVHVVAMFRYFESAATWCDTSNVISRNAFSNASYKS
jgi:hypothetical protein